MQNEPHITPQWPKPDTDNRRMLEALIAAAPDFAWNLNYALELTAHSRASDLRDLGWLIEWEQRSRPGKGRKRDNGYRLLNPPTQGEAAA